MKKLFIYFILTLYAYTQEQYTNRLINETSLYLIQHAHNPVNWYPWGTEAFERAKKENKLIFLSLGYSTCHWCHVMNSKTLNDEEVGKLLNDDFISIKVDREEYPQLNRRFQRVYKAVKKKKGGWPMSVFMSPDAEIFSMATYIPKNRGYGSIGMVNMLPKFLKLQKDTKLFNAKIKKYLLGEKNISKNLKLANPMGEKIIDSFMKKIILQFDVKNGGCIKKNKYPEVAKMELLLDIYALRGDKMAFNMLDKTLTNMANGGIYDQLGGGFFRYTLDKEWEIPHFEKMLYTNAKLIPIYVKLYKKTKNPLYKKVVYETINHIENFFVDQCSYFSATDSDSEGEEGGYFIFEYEVVKKELLHRGLKIEGVEEVLAYLGIEEDGNIDGDFSHLHITSSIIPKYLDVTKKYLKEVISEREYPFIDKKIITAWNAMMVKALFVAGELDKKYELLGESRLETLLSIMFKNDVLYHQTHLGDTPKQKAILEDYAFLIDTLIESYTRTYKKEHLELALKLSNRAIKFFYRENKWYLSNDGIKALADFNDRYYASGLSVMLDNLVRLSSLSYELKYIKIVKDTIKSSGAILEKNPTKASKLVHTYLRLVKGDMTIKSTFDKLKKHRKKIEAIEYPFILSAVDNIDKYIGCKVQTCFVQDKNITNLIKKINEEAKE